MRPVQGGPAQDCRRPAPPAATGWRWSAWATSAARRWPTWCSPRGWPTAGLAERVEVTSSGTGDWHVGHPMDERAAATLTRAGYDATRHRARQFAADWLEDRDLVLAMDAANLADVRAAGPATPDGRVRLFRDFDPRRARRRRARPVLRWGRRIRGGPRHGRADGRRPGHRPGRPPSAGRGPRDPPARARPPGRGAPRLRGGGDLARRRRRHRDDHPAAAQRRHDRADEDPRARPGRLLRDRGRRAGLARRARGRRGPRGAGRRPGLPDPAVDRAGPQHPRRRRRPGPRPGRHARRRRRRRTARSGTGSSAGCRCPTGRRTRGRSSTPCAGCCRTCAWPATAAP